MSTTFKQVKNNAKSLAVFNELNNTTTTLTFSIEPDDGDKFPVTGDDYWITAWDNTKYVDPGDDPNMRIGLCTNRTDDELTVTWGQFSTPIVAMPKRPAIALLVIDQHLKDIYTAINNIEDDVQYRIVTTCGSLNSDFPANQLQQAIDFVYSLGGGTVLMTDYDYYPTAILRPKSNVHLRGLGRGVTTIHAPTSSVITRVFYHDGLTAGHKYLENWTASDFTVDMSEKQTMGQEIRFFRNFHQYNTEWKNVKCLTTGGASRWCNKFGTIEFVAGVSSPSTSESEDLHLHDNYYHDNFTRTFEVVLATNTKGIKAYGNKFSGNSASANVYDEVSFFIYNDDVDYHDNVHSNSLFNGVGAKESNRVRIHDNTIAHTNNTPTNYTGIRVWNTEDSSVYDNKIIGPDLYDLTGTVTATGETVTIRPGEWNEVVFTTTSTIELTGVFDITKLYAGQPVYSTLLPEGCTIISIDAPNDKIYVNKTATSTGSINLKMGHSFVGVSHADRNIGYDGHSLRNPYTRSLTIKDNKIKNAYSGITSGAASLGVDVVGFCDIASPRIVTITNADYTLDGVDYMDTTETTKHLFVGEKLYGVGIADDTVIVSIDSDTQITVNKDMPITTGLQVTFDANTISYRQSDIYIDDNEFEGILRNAVAWGADHADTDVKRFYVRRNTVAPWYGTGGGAIQIRGSSADITKFTDLFVEDNVIHENLEGTAWAGIRLLGLTARSVKRNVIPTYGTLGRVNLASNAKITDLQENFVTFDANLTLSWHDFVFMDATSGNRTVALPDPALYTGKEYYIMKVDSSSNTVTIDPTGFNPINGVPTNVLTAQNQGIRVKSNGVGWYITSSTAIGTQTLQATYDSGNTISIGNNKPLAITNNDTTNNPDTATITQTSTGTGFRVNVNAVLAATKYGIFIDSGSAQVNAALMRIRMSNASSTQPLLQLDNSGTGYTLSLGGVKSLTATGDIEITDATKGIILKSPDNTRRRITIDNAGALVITAI